MLVLFDFWMDYTIRIPDLPTLDTFIISNIAYENDTFVIQFSEENLFNNLLH
jgi:hypothetical protein